MFVAIEGIDGSGKTTLAKALAAAMRERGRDVVLTAEPTELPVGRIIKGLVEVGLEPETETLLFMADRCEHVERIKRWLDDGWDVIADRYVFSTVAYQGERLLKKHGAEMEEWIWQVFAPFDLMPDIVILLDVDPEVGVGRLSGRGNRERFEDVSFLRGVRERYLRMAMRFSFLVLNGGEDKEKLLKQALEAVMAHSHSNR